MDGRPSSFITQEWCVHAQLTISHRPPDAPPTPRPADDGVRLEYSWNSVPPAKPSPSYGFQRGNITFTTRPPSHPPQPHDSGYNSLPGRGKVQQPYNRRCKSTCSITLSGVHDEDSWRGDVSAPKKEVSPVQEVCEVCGGDRSPLALRRAANYTTHFCTRVAERVRPCEEGHQGQDAGEEAGKSVEVKQSQDVASQTQECQVESVKKPLQPRMGYKAVYSSGRKTDTALLQVPDLDLPQAGNDKAKPGKRLSRSPARLSGKSPLLGGPQRPPRTQKPSREKKSSSRSPDSVSTSHRPRTVHIDVYCTGSDASGSSSDSSDSSTTPQTVFESNKVRVVHTRVGRDRLPQALQREPSLTSNLPRSITDRVKSESFKQQSHRDEKVCRGYDSDDGLSSQYPSQISSFSSIEQSSAVTSRDPSSSTLSSSSFALTEGEGYDSAAATSCKDTMTDIDTLSLVHSSLSLAPSDSFEYADSMDRVRIKEREQAWASKGDEDSKTWRSPQSERKQMLQQQKLKEFLQKHLGTSAFPLWKTEKTDDSEDDDDDDTGDAWSFAAGSSKECPLKREDTVRKAMPPEAASKPDVKKGMAAQDLGSLSDSSHQRVVHHFKSRSPSPCPSKVLSCIASPFTSRMGVRTDQLSRAEKFGTIVGVFRKPGHHVGPSKNPECSCAHCRNYCEQIGYRSRTRSLDITLEAADNWKTQLQEQLAKRAQNDSRKAREITPHYDEQWDDSNAV